MPAVEEQGLTKLAVYWEISGRDEFADPTFLDPVEIPVRWEHMHREMTDPQGQSIIISAKVASKQRLKDGSVLYLGTYDQYLGVGSGSDEGGIMQVVGYEQADDIRGREVRREALLSRYKRRPT